MKLSGADGAKWTAASPTRGDDKSLENGGEFEATVEEVLNLGEVSIDVLLEGEGVVGDGQRRLEIAKEGVDG
jgi:hypothetical protein